MSCAQLPTHQDLNVLGKTQELMIQQLFNQDFYDEDLETSTVESRDFVQCIILDIKWAAERRKALRMLRMIDQLKDTAEEQWASESSKFIHSMVLILGNRGTGI